MIQYQVGECIRGRLFARAFSVGVESGRIPKAKSMISLSVSGRSGEEVRDNVLKY
jgi:hypothetical protein